ncbi:MAG: efflux RND transporter periplasmic adaptor subunit [Proteobacteria bacterium]|nr:efflux RND transporter periplasmic adaptor subunit [Pseudomonadota bacterium]
MPDLRGRGWRARGRRVNDNRSNDDLLHQLRIDRAQRDDDESPRRWPWIVAVIVAIVVIAGGIAAFTLRGQAMTVQTSTAVAAASGSDAAVLQATGYVVARRMATVSAQIIGTLTQVSVEEGETVKEGQVLARLDPTAYQAQLDAVQAQHAAAQAQVAQARATLMQARADAARNNAILKQGYISAQAAQQANTQVAADAAALDVAIKQVAAAAAQVQAARVNLGFTIIRAPFAGVITAKDADVGEIVSPYTAGGGGIAGGLATIVDMNSLEVDVDVNEAYISRVVPNMPVQAVLDAYPDWKIPAHVIAIIPSADKSKATVKVRIALDQKDPRIIPQMGVRVSFLEKKDANRKPLPGVLVPKSAVVQRGGKDVVFVVTDGRARQTTVTTGGDFSDMKQVTQGLSAGAEVVTTPSADLKDGEKVQVKAAGN